MNDPPLKTFGQLLRFRRRELNLTLNHVATACGMTQPSLTLIERGKRTPPEMVPFVLDLAACLQLPTSEPPFRQFIDAAYRERFGKELEPRGSILLHDLAHVKELALTRRLQPQNEELPDNSLDTTPDASPEADDMHSPSTVSEPAQSKEPSVKTLIDRISTLFSSCKILRFEWRKHRIEAEVRLFGSQEWLLTAVPNCKRRNRQNARVDRKVKRSARTPNHRSLQVKV